MLIINQNMHSTCNRRTMISVSLCSVLALVATMIAIESIADESDTDRAEADRRERIEKMTPEQKQQLRRNKDLFDKLGGQEKKKIRELEKAIEQNPRCEELRTAMRRYYQWLGTLDAHQRASLRELVTATPRLERVRGIHQQQLADRKKAGPKLNPTDIEVVKRWSERIAEKHKQLTLKNLDPRFRKRIDTIDDKKKRAGMLRFAFWMSVGNRESWAKLEEQDIDTLAKELSGTGKQYLTKAGADRQPIVIGWVRASWYSHFKKSHSPEEMVKIFDSLNPEQQGKLRSLQPHEMQQVLHMFRRMNQQQRDTFLSMSSQEISRYLTRHHSERSRRGRPPRRGGSGREGLRRPGDRPNGGRGRGERESGDRGRGERNRGDKDRERPRPRSPFPPADKR